MRETFDGMRLKVEVKDTGPGIAEEDQERVFQPFEQSESGRQTKGGTGLGLAISREYARILGGDLTVASRVGEGSVFRLEIDIQDGIEVNHREEPSKARVAGLADGQRVPRVLIAEDEEESRILLFRLLQMAGFEVRAATNGLEAVEMSAVWRPHFIWMDVRMPTMDELEATQRIKSSEAGKYIPIVALTASVLKEEREPILAGGCDDFVRKPYREQEIFDVMAKHLRLKYVYEDEQVEKARIDTEVELTGQRLASVASNLLGELRDAVVRLDMNHTSKVIEKITAHDADIGAALKTVAESLEYDRLLAWLDEDGRNPEGWP